MSFRGRLSILAFASVALSAALPSFAHAVAVPAPESSGAERRWTRALSSGQTEFVVLHGEGGIYTVDVIREAPRSLPRLTLSRRFRDLSEAMGFAQKTASSPPADAKVQSLSWDFRSARPASPAAATGVSLWKVTQSWSWEWEKRYAEWIRNEVDLDFFVKHQLANDCADVAFALRWIFARNHGLPAANRLAGSGVLFTQDSMLPEWAKLPSHADWSQDRRFRAALEYFLNLTYTQTLRRDSYPIEISPESFMPGAHHLSLPGSGGHTWIVKGTDFSPTSTQPIEMMASTVPREVRVLDRLGFWRLLQPEEAKDGLLRFRWPVKTMGQWDLAPEDSHPRFSREQYLPEFVKGYSSFAEAVLLKLIPNMDFVARLEGGVEEIRTQFGMRKDVVARGYEACKASGCAEDSKAYDDWSTFSRDKRIQEVATQLKLIALNVGEVLPKVKAAWSRLSDAPILSLDGEVYSLKEVLLAWEQATYSSDPRHSVQTRWGVAPASFAAGLGRRFDALLLKRASRIASQAKVCSRSSDCKPDSPEWAAAHTFDLDRSLSLLPSALNEYCWTAPSARCEALALARDAVTVGASVGRPMPLEQWVGVSQFLVSDPRAPLEVRWGANATSRRSYVFDGKSRAAIDVSRSGLAAYKGLTPGAREGDFLVFSADTVVVDLKTGVPLPPPAGRVWGAFDSASDWAIALPPKVALGAPMSIVVRDPRKGGKATRFGGVVAHPKMMLEWQVPGVLMVRSGENEIDLLDLNTQPATHLRGLPFRNPSIRRGQAFAWTGASDNKNYELFVYRDGRLSRNPLLPGILKAGEAIGRWEDLSGDAIVGSYGPCIDRDCVSVHSRAVFIADLRTGKGRVIGSGHDVCNLTRDGRWLLHTSLQSNARSELISLDESLSEVSRREFGGEVMHIVEEPGADRFVFRDPRGRIRLLRYASGDWNELKLLPDEKAFAGSRGEFVVAATAKGTHRVRRFDGTQALFEGEEGALVRLIGARDEGTSLPAVLLMHPREPESQFVYDLSRPEQPLLTGFFFHIPESEREWQREQAHPIVMPQGFLLQSAVSGGRSFWIDDLP
jgi:hypothetical protein